MMTAKHCREPVSFGTLGGCRLSDSPMGLDCCVTQRKMLQCLATLNCLGHVIDSVHGI